jgi:YidC/Oxa1 family membrane protein insertase
MAKMKAVAPRIKAVQERHKDDRQAQAAAMMELYKREKINPLSGCLPMLIQIPVFYALYTVLFITIEMRHAPFFGWIQDLAAPDPTNIFTLFGLLNWDPTIVPVFGHFMMIGFWPLIMGATMWLQMRLNPPPPDPTQAMIFHLMPVIFTFTLGTFPAGLVIYYSWNNTLSIIQQSIIMKRHGAEVNLFGNIVASFRRTPKTDKAGG